MDRPHDPNTMYRAGNTYRGVISLNQLAKYRDGVRDGGVVLMHRFKMRSLRRWTTDALAESALGIIRTPKAYLMYVRLYFW
jgi:hypothetical protein